MPLWVLSTGKNNIFCHIFPLFRTSSDILVMIMKLIQSLCDVLLDSIMDLVSLSLLNIFIIRIPTQNVLHCYLVLCYWPKYDQTIDAKG